MKRYFDYKSFKIKLNCISTLNIHFAGKMAFVKMLNVKSRICQFGEIRTYFPTLATAPQCYLQGTVQEIITW